MKDKVLEYYNAETAQYLEALRNGELEFEEYHSNGNLKSLRKKAMRNGQRISLELFITETGDTTNFMVNLASNSRSQNPKVASRALLTRHFVTMESDQY